MLKCRNSNKSKEHTGTGLAATGRLSEPQAPHEEDMN
jgi:hypothetical protein